MTGQQAAGPQFDKIVTSRLPYIITVVIAVAFLLIMTAFRSLPLAIKAAVLNLFSIAAAYGVIVAVFQFGWGRSLLGVSENVPVEAYVPMIMFAIVFGLSMDYEVFLLSRVKEAWDRTRDHHEAVTTGLASTGRVITCAALIMIAVFISFVTSTTSSSSSCQSAWPSASSSTPPSSGCSWCPPSCTCSAPPRGGCPMARPHPAPHRHRRRARTARRYQAAAGCRAVLNWTHAAHATGPGLLSEHPR